MCGRHEVGKNWQSRGRAAFSPAQRFGIVISDIDAAGELGGKTDEPCVFGRVCGAGFSCDIERPFPELSACGAFGCDGFEHRRQHICNVRFDGFMLGLRGRFEGLAVSGDGKHELGGFVRSSGCDRGIGVGDVEIGHAGASKGQGIVFDEGGFDAKFAHELNGLVDAGAFENVDGDGVARLGQGRARCHGAFVLVVGVFGRPGFFLPGDVKDLRGVVDDGGRRDDAGFEGGAIDERLEGRARLSLGLGGAVKDGFPVIVSADHGPDFVRVDIDGNERSVGSAWYHDFFGFSVIVKREDLDEPRLPDPERLSERGVFLLSRGGRVGEFLVGNGEKYGIAVNSGNFSLVIFVFFVLLWCFARWIFQGPVHVVALVERHESFLERGLGLALQLEVKRRGDDESRVIDVVASVFGNQGLADVFGEVGRRPQRGVVVMREGDGFLKGCAVDVFGDMSLLKHLA